MKPPERTSTFIDSRVLMGRGPYAISPYPSL